MVASQISSAQTEFQSPPAGRPAPRAMFSTRKLLVNLLPAGPRSGSYQVSSREHTDDELCLGRTSSSCGSAWRGSRDLPKDANNNSNDGNHLGASSLELGEAYKCGQSINSEPTRRPELDFNQNNARPMRKLRSISFCRLIYLRQTSSRQYDLRADRRRPSRMANHRKSRSPHRPLQQPQQQQPRPPTTQLQDGVTLCSLGVGTTFGASVMPGKSHSVSVVTNEECTLLRVRRADFQEILNEQSHLISDVESSPFCSFTSLNRIASATSDSGALTRALRGGPSLPSGGPSGSAAAAAPGGRRPSLLPAQAARRGSIARAAAAAGPQPQPASGSNQPPNGFGPPRQALEQVAAAQAAAAAPSREQEELGEEEDEANLESLSPNELASQLVRIGWVLRTLILGEQPSLIQNRRVHPHQKLLNSLLACQRREAAAAAASKSLAKQPKQLMSTGSSSQLLSGPSVGQQTKAAGRKVVGYVANSLNLRGSSSSSSSSTSKLKPQQQQQPVDRLLGAHGSFSCSSFDSSSAQALGNHLAESEREPAGHRSHWAERAQLAESSAEAVQLRRCMVGRELVDWLVQLGQRNPSAARFVSSRLQAVSMWQVLLEQGVLFALSTEPPPSSSSSTASTSANSSHERLAGSQQELSASLRLQQAAQFCDDRDAFYRFRFDFGSAAAAAVSATSASGSGELSRPSEQELALARESLWWSLKVLSKLAPDACFRLILSKPPEERSGEEVDIVFEELQHHKALSHLTNSVKKELAACVQGEHQARQNTIVFNQGDPGHCWYIILRGSVNVVIVGKGVVCTLHDGDDFGKLALVNDAPRAATIVTNEPNCYFLRVDKNNFNTILRDVEANTVRLKEHGLYHSGRPVQICAHYLWHPAPLDSSNAANATAPTGKEVLILQKVAVKEALTTLPAPAGPPTGQSVQTDPGGQPALEGLAANSSQAQQQQQPPTAQPQQQPPQQQQLQPLPAQLSQQQQPSSALKYMVMAGTAEKMLGE